MSKIFIILFMLFMHILDDFVLQSIGFLANGKQQSWWKQNASDDMYKHDYLACLIMHSLSWSFAIMLPIAIYYQFNVGFAFLGGFVLNALIHGITDDLKANQHMLNLLEDQSIHLMQIIFTAIYLLWVIAPMI